MAKAAGSRTGVTLRCSECGWQTAKWVGRCGECQAWGTVGEPGGTPGRATAPGPVTAPAQRIPDVDAELTQMRPTGVDELDRVLGGGLVPGGVVLLAGEPGVGKSTLLLEVAARYASPATPTLYVTGEESAGQVRVRAGRTGALDPSLYLAAETDLARDPRAPRGRPAVAAGRRLRADHRLGRGRRHRGRGHPGPRGGCVPHPGGEDPGHRHGPGRPRHQGRLDRRTAAARAPRRRRAGLRGRPALDAAHGPRDQEPLRPRRRGRAASSSTTAASAGWPTPAGCSSPRPCRRPSPGTCVTVTLEGRRPLAAEVQALVVPSQAGSPRRATGGLDGSRIAHAARRPPAALPHPAGAVRGLRLHRRRRPHHRAGRRPRRRRSPSPRPPRSSRCAAASSPSARSGLAGEIRRVPSVSRRLAEAARLGFTHALVPPDSGPLPDGIRVAHGRQPRRRARRRAASPRER